MRKLIVLMMPLALFLLNPQGLFAQQEKKEDVLTEKGAATAEQEINLEQLRAELELSDEQFTQLKAISETYQVKRMELKGQNFDSKGTKMQAHKDLMKAQLAEMNEVLSEEQQTKMMELLQKQGKAGYEGRQKKGDGGSR